MIISILISFLNKMIIQNIDKININDEIKGIDRFSFAWRTRSFLHLSAVSRFTPRSSFIRLLFFALCVLLGV